MGSKTKPTLELLAKELADGVLSRWTESYLGDPESSYCWFCGEGYDSLPPARYHNEIKHLDSCETNLARRILEEVKK